MATAIDPIEVAKNAGVLLTAGSGLSYGCGYLVVRGRAYALGTDPGFVLLDQNYVFAGFRFMLMTLFALLVTSPLLLPVVALSRQVGAWNPTLLATLEWMAAVLLGSLTVAGFHLTLAVNNVVLDSYRVGRPRTLLADAALDRNNLGVLAVVSATLIATCSVLLLRARLAEAGAGDLLTTLLLVIAALDFVLLPLQHGIFLADRKARALERAPEGYPGLEAPIWIIDRGANDRVVLLIYGNDRHFKLVTTKADKLDGIPVTAVISLGEALCCGVSP